MAQLKLTIAGLAGTFRLGFQHLANKDMTFEARASGMISVERGLGGSQYTIVSKVDDFRVEIKMVAEEGAEITSTDDCTNYGWWKLGDNEKVDFTPGEELKNRRSDSRKPEVRSGKEI